MPDNPSEDCESLAYWYSEQEVRGPGRCEYDHCGCRDWAECGHCSEAQWKYTVLSGWAAGGFGSAGIGIIL